MSPEGYDAFEDPYCYPGTSVLRNRLNAQNLDAACDVIQITSFGARRR
jgi:GH24 family phage-related lysozyme (muramidase)